MIDQVSIDVEMRPSTVRRARYLLCIQVASCNADEGRRPKTKNTGP